MLKEHPELWEVPLRFEIAPTPGLLDDSEAAGTSEAVTRAWNGMGAFPYSHDQRLESFERTLLLGSTRLGSWNPELDKKLGRMLAESPDNVDRWIEVSLGARNGAWSKGLVCFSDLVNALRADIDNVISADGRALVSSDPLEFIRRVRDPSLIFDIRRLADCFVQNAIPTQVLLQGAELPVIFSPAQLIDLWPTQSL
jgi:hypothetical protein